MRRAYSFTLEPSATAIREPVTKFGGQPVWYGAPQWPVSKTTGEQMMFICQILLYPEIFGNVQGKMAYLFITDIQSTPVPTWEPDMGENAVIIQPGRSPQVETKPLATGPSIYQLIEVPETNTLQPRPCEFSVNLVQRSDPDFIEETVRGTLDDEGFDRYSQACEGNKIGGTPLFLQEDRLPPSGHLLLQMDSTKVPFSINFGDCGVGYAFISPDGTAGRFLWQCYL